MHKCLTCSVVLVETRANFEKVFSQSDVHANLWVFCSNNIKKLHKYLTKPTSGGKIHQELILYFTQLRSPARAKKQWRGAPPSGVKGGMRAYEKEWAWKRAAMAATKWKKSEKNGERAVKINIEKVFYNNWSLQGSLSKGQNRKASVCNTPFLDCVVHNIWWRFNWKLN